MRRRRYKLRGEGYYYLRGELLGEFRLGAEEREFLMRLSPPLPKIPALPSPLAGI